jgi:uncharacterized protein (TIGR03067 family)
MRPCQILLCLAFCFLLAAEPKERDNETNRDKKKMQDVYEAIGVFINGETRDTKNQRLIVKGDVMTFMKGDEATMRATFKLDAVPDPKHIDLVFLPDDKEKGKGLEAKGIYSLGAGDQVALCVAKPGEDRPTAFASKKGDKVMFTMLFQRVKPKEKE